MLTIFHGNDTVSSRKFFLDQKSKNKDAVLLDGEKISLTDLAQNLEGGELFTSEKNIFIEQLLSKKKKSKEKDAIIAFLQKNTTEHNIFLWEDKELDRTNLSHFKTAVVKAFKLPQTLFAFLDSLKPGNSKALISHFHQTLETSEPEMIFFMLVRQFRLLLALNPSQPPLIRGGVPTPSLIREGRGGFEKSEGVIDELKRMAPWQKTRLETQAKIFGIEKLKRIYNKLFQIELAQKTGNLSGSLISTIDFLLIET